MKRIIKFIAYLLVLFLIYVAAILIHGGLTDYQPEAIIQLESERESPQKVIEDSTFSLLTWNIGYGGLGAEADFFYHGSGFFVAGDNMVRPDRLLSEKFMNGICRTIEDAPSDFILLQEVDFESKRSYYTNQFEKIGSLLPAYSACKATNFKVSRVPAPVLQPWQAYGQCYSGLATYSKYAMSDITRYQLPGSFSWPNKPFMLDRCLQVSRYNLKNGKELVLVNIHNTAYEKDGKRKLEQLAFLKDLLIPEYEKGNYVIAGGDWNQSPPGLPRDYFKKADLTGFSNLNIPEKLFPEDWRWIYDPGTPTNRSNKDPFVPKETFTSLIDFFLISPNIRAVSVKSIDQQFAFSDHQPVRMEVEIN